MIPRYAPTFDTTVSSETTRRDATRRSEYLGVLPEATTQQRNVAEKNNGHSSLTTFLRRPTRNAPYTREFPPQPTVVRRRDISYHGESCRIPPEIAPCKSSNADLATIQAPIVQANVCPPVSLPTYYCHRFKPTPRKLLQNYPQAKSKVTPIA